MRRILVAGTSLALVATGVIASQSSPSQSQPQSQPRDARPAEIALSDTCAPGYMTISTVAREVANEKPNSALGRLAVERTVLGEDVAELAREGDEAARSVLEETGRWLGIGLAGFVNVFNPEVIAIGGGAARAGDLILDAARHEVHLRAMSPGRDLVEIKEASLGAQSGILGAAALARDPSSGEYVLGT